MTREEAIKVIDGRFEIMGYCEDPRLEEALDLAIESLKQPQPRKKGKWIDKSDDIEGAWNYCSVCMEQAIDLYDFCPNCGADMREGDSE